MNRVGLKERIAISEAFSTEERDFLLDAINAMPDMSNTLVEVPGNYMGRIDQIWAYLSVDAGGEGIIGAPIDGRSTLPLIAADKTRLDQIRPWAFALARALKAPVRLVRFKNREEVEVILP
jgi:hypothetical protein